MVKWLLSYGVTNKLTNDLTSVLTILIIGIMVVRIKGPSD